jgi:cytidine deaminase
MQPKHVTPLLRSALKAMRLAYAPYSRVKVGASLVARSSKTGKSKVFSGANVENASFGATVCAERVAIFQAVSQGFDRVEGIAIATHASPPWSPCGLCRQVLAEFADDALPIFLTNPKGVRKETTLGKLFPSSFSRSQLDKA